MSRFDASATGGDRFWEEYDAGARHASAGHDDRGGRAQLATRLYQNTARVHFDQLQQSASRHGRRIVYGGHVISVAHALSFDGLENVLGVAVVERRLATNPTFAGDTLFAWSDVLERIDIGRDDIGALRLRLVAVKIADPSREEIALKVAGDDGRERYHANVVLDLDYVALIPKRAAAD